MKCPERAVLEAVAVGMLDPWPEGLELHLDGCAQCLEALVELSATTQPEASTTTAVEDGPLPEMPADRYAFVGELGRGGQSRVLRAYDRLLRREVAFKQFVPGSAAPGADTIARDRFVREIGIMADLSHPGVIPILDVGVRDDWPYCTMQVVEGQTLAEARSGDVPDLDRLLSRFVSVCEAVDFAHQQGIVHRDLKPDNIMIGPFGETYVLDWALAKRTTDTRPSEGELGASTGAVVTQQGAAVGTPAYMSPEHLDPTAAADPRSDVYSLGAVLLFVVCGRAPFTARSLEQAMAKLRATHERGLDPDVLRDVAPELAAVIRTATASSPSNRYPSAAALARDVEAYRTDRRVSVARYPIALRLARFARRRPGWIAGGLVVSAVTAVGWLVTGAALRSETHARERTEVALEQAEDATEQATRATAMARQQAARARFALADAHAQRAAELQRTHRTLAARAFAGRALAEASTLELELEPQQREALRWTQARARGVLLLEQRDPVKGLIGTRAIESTSVRFVEDGGGRYVVLDRGRRVIVRAVEDGEVVAERPSASELSSVALSPSGNRVAHVERGESASIVVAWSVVDGSEVRWETDVAPDGTLSVTDEGVVAFNGPDRSVKVARPGQDPREVTRMANWGVALSPDGSAVAVSGTNGTLAVVDADTGAPRYVCDGHEDPLTRLRWNAESTRVIAGCVGGHLLTCSSVGLERLDVHAGRVTALALSDDGRFVSSAGFDETIAVTDLDAGRVRAVFDAPRETVFALHADEGGRLSAFTATQVVSWTIRTDAASEVRSVGHAVQRVVELIDGRLVVPHGTEPKLVSVDPHGGAAQTIALPDSEPPGFLFSAPDGEVGTLSFGGQLSYWRPDARQWDLQRRFEDRGSNVNAAVRRGDTLAIEQKAPYGVALWSAGGEAPRGRLEGHDAAVSALALTDDGSTLASADLAGRINVWNVESLDKVATLRDGGAAVFGIAADGRGGWVVASNDGVAHYRAHDEPPRWLDERRGYRYVATGANHRRLAASSFDGRSIAVWDLTTDEVLLDLDVDVPVANLRFSDDGAELWWLSSRQSASVRVPASFEPQAWLRRAERAELAARSERTGLVR